LQGFFVLGYHLEQ